MPYFMRQFHFLYPFIFSSFPSFPTLFIVYPDLWYYFILIDEFKAPTFSIECDLYSQIQELPVINRHVNKLIPAKLPHHKQQPTQQIIILPHSLPSPHLNLQQLRLTTSLPITQQRPWNHSNSITQEISLDDRCHYQLEKTRGRESQARLDEEESN